MTAHHNTSLREIALRTTSAIAIIACSLVTSDSASAQSAASSNGNSVEEVVVSGTRVVRDGFSAPTPTTVLGADEIYKMAPTNIADLVNELPSLAGSVTPTTAVGAVSPGTVGINALNLRDLGPSRTLVLLDGQRVAPSTLTGWVDVNEFPQALVKRVDVVTGGASADWGSDAVAGVVNFVLDKDFTGLKGQAQGGITTYGDDANYNLSLTAGTGFLNGRGHVLLSLEDAYDDGVRGVPRNWYNGDKAFFNPAYTPTNGQPQISVGSHVGYVYLAPGGLINTGPLTGTYFGPGGTPRQFNYGLSNGFNMQGGDWQLSDFATSGDLAPKLTRQNAFFRTSYDITDHFQIFAQASYGRATSYEIPGSHFNFGSTIQPDNAFIPASVAPQVTGPFSLSTNNQDLGPAIATTARSSWRFVVGANGDFDALGSNWKWDVYGQEGTNIIYTAAKVENTANYANAIDAVRNSSGVIVCRSTLTNPNNGCVPFDVFGTGVNTQTADNYILGTSWGRSRLTQDVFAGTVHGTPISDWAGPISVVAGVEHRREAVTGTNDPLSPSKVFFVGNYTASHGSYDVTEGFFEAVVPLAKDLPFAKSLDFDGAVRETGYSTSGLVTTWKAGLNYTPIDGVTFRATQSRDIRAPNLAELFTAGQTSSIVVTDPFKANAGTSIFQVTGGNLNLQPEKADTTGIGIVLQPDFLPGFGASVDYYNVAVAGAIQAVDSQTLINQCFAGNTALCSQIVRNGSGTITQVLVGPVNLAKQISRGIDFEASYKQSLEEIFPSVGGDLTLRMLATRYLKNYASNGINTPTDEVGNNSATNNSSGVISSLPLWRLIGTVGWDKGPLAVLFTARGVSAGVLDTSYVQCASACPASTPDHMTISNNHVPGAFYFDTSITYNLTDQIDTYFAVNNIADTSPVQVPYGPNLAAVPLSVNPALYDVLGRSYRMGFRFKM